MKATYTLDQMTIKHVYLLFYDIDIRYVLITDVKKSYTRDNGKFQKNNFMNELSIKSFIG